MSAPTTNTNTNTMSTTEKPDWAKYLKESRAKLGLSQPKMAALLGVGFEAYSSWERGRNTSPAFVRKSVTAMLQPMLDALPTK